jgi:crossover junction endodeoxyribonuclease RusA
VNHYWCRNRNGRLRIGTRGVEFRNHVARTLNADRIGRIEPPARVRVWVEVHFGDARRRDLDNLSKSMLDAMTKSGAWEDDEQIDDLRITRKEIDRDDPRVIVHWEEIGKWE